MSHTFYQFVGVEKKTVDNYCAEQDKKCIFLELISTLQSQHQQQQQQQQHYLNNHMGNRENTWRRNEEREMCCYK